jgi:hypothetical protein
VGLEMVYVLVVCTAMLVVIAAVCHASTRKTTVDVCTCEHCGHRGVKDEKNLPKAWVKVVYQDVWLFGRRSEADFCCIKCLHEHCLHTHKTEEITEDLDGDS